MTELEAAVTVTDWVTALAELIAAEILSQSTRVHRHLRDLLCWQTNHGHAWLTDCGNVRLDYSSRLDFAEVEAADRALRLTLTLWICLNSKVAVKD